MAGKVLLRFDISIGGELLRKEELDAESVTIGRGPAAMLRIDNPALADLHAVINVNDDGSVQILDLGGPTGTSVNGSRVSSTKLESGDRIEVGPVKIQVNVTNASAFEDEEKTVLAVGARSPATGARKTPITEEDDTDQQRATMRSEKSIPAPPTSPGGGAATAGAVAPSAVAADGKPQVESEDVMTFMMKAVAPGNEQGLDRSKPKVLEVAQVWHDEVLDVKHYPRGGPPITVGSSEGHRWRIFGRPVAWIGDTFAKYVWMLGPGFSEANEEWKNEFYLAPDNLPHDDFALFEWKGNQYVANISEKWTGFIDQGEKRTTFQELIQQGKAEKNGQGLYQVPVEDETQVVADLGGNVFFGHLVYPGQKVVAKVTEQLDYPFLGVMTFLLFVFVCLGVVILTSPPPPDNEMMEIPDRFVELLLQQPEPEPKKDNKPKADPDAGEGAKAKKEEGKVGKKDAKMKEAKGNKVEMKKRELDKEIAENAGVLGALSDADQLQGVFGSALSSDLTGGIGGLIGAKGTQFGSGCLGARGSGLGGGGSADGIGGLGTKGRGSGASGYGSGGGNFGAKGEGGIGRIGGDPIILGALDKSLIDAVIKRNMNQIRYCYQRELTKQPDLAGKITVKFVISKTGSVSKAETKTSTMGNPTVESCIADRFLHFQFPEPKGGGIVIVSYPFIFSPG